MRALSCGVLACLLLMAATGPLHATDSEPVNAVIGDTSWVARFGATPTASADPVARIRTHLEYVEALLRRTDVSALSSAQRARRLASLDVLAAYHRAGRFPINDERPHRTPRFVDAYGTLCAVGRLIEASAGLSVVLTIQRAHEWDYLLDMHEPVITAWANEHGFTLQELAMIQPSYEWGSVMDNWDMERFNTGGGPARPRRRGFARDLAAAKPYLRECVAALLTQTPHPIEITIQADWPVGHKPVNTWVSLTPASAPSLACIEAKLERYLAKKYPVYFADSPFLSVKIRLSFERPQMQR